MQYRYCNTLGKASLLQGPSPALGHHISWSKSYVQNRGRKWWGRRALPKRADLPNESSTACANQGSCPTSKNGPPRRLKKTRECTLHASKTPPSCRNRSYALLAWKWQPAYYKEGRMSVASATVEWTPKIQSHPICLSNPVQFLNA